MESKKETAVEWLVNQFNTIVFYCEEAKQQTIEQAKKMEKEQIKDAYFLGGYDVKNNRYKGMHEYYEQTYGGNK
jgi:hypothetical protein